MSLVLPFRWVGAKRRMVPKLVEIFPENKSHFYEIFGGRSDLTFSVFDKAERIHLSDANLRLINTLNIIKYYSKDLLDVLLTHEINALVGGREYYNKILKDDSGGDGDNAAKFIYRQNHCYKGVYSEDEDGKFGTGYHFNAKKFRFSGFLDQHGKLIDDKEERDLLACSEILREKTEIRCCDFRQVDPVSGSVVFIDPPYLRKDGRSSGYVYSYFFRKHHEELRDYVLRLCEKDISVIMTNLDSEFIRELYRDSVFRFLRVTTVSGLNFKPMKELIITNYETKEAETMNKNKQDLSLELLAVDGILSNENLKEFQRGYLTRRKEDLERLIDGGQAKPILTLNFDSSGDLSQKSNGNKSRRSNKKLKQIPEDLRLRIIAKQRDKSNTQMAIDLNVTQNTLKNLKDGAGTFREKTLTKIGELVGWSNNHSNIADQQEDSI